MALLNSISHGTAGPTGGSRKHYCGIPKNDCEQLSMISPFLLDGLRRNDKCVFVADRVEKAVLFEHMMETAPVSREFLETRISFLSADEVYLKGGRFDMHRMLRFLADTRDQSVREGHAGLAAVGEMTWANRDAPGVSDLIEYEARVNFMYPDSSADMLCQYPESEFDPGTLVNALRTHPKVIVKGMICGNPYYLPPDTLISYVSGFTTVDVLERMEKELVSRSVRSEISALESRELRRARTCLDVLDEMALDSLRDKAEAASFLHELALCACKDDDIAAHIKSADSRVTELMDILDTIKTFRACMDAPAEWQSLEGVVRSAADMAIGDSRKISLFEGRFKVFASSAADKAIAAIFSAVSDMSPGSSKVCVEATETDFGLTVTIGAAGPGIPEGFKESVFSMSGPIVCGRSLCLSREVLESAGICVREVGVPGKSTVFEVHFPVGRYEAL